MEYVWDTLTSISVALSRATSLNVVSKECLTEDLTEEEHHLNNKILDDYMQSIENKAENFEALEVPVVFHSIQPFPFIAHLTKWQIERQITVLNEAFTGTGNTLYPNDCDGNRIDYDSSERKNARITFKLEAIRRKYHPLWFFFPLRFYSTLKETLHEGDCTTLNIYTAYFQKGLGISSNPMNCETRTKFDGVVIDLRTLPKGIVRNEDYDEGDTLVHEVGHWLGLSHTFVGGCNSAANDGISDTPRQTSPTFGCPIGRDTCPFQDGLDPIHNFMDYSDDCCMFEFTSEQILRMQASLEYRFNISQTTF